MNNLRKKSGSVTAFSIGCVILVVIIGVFAYKLASLLGSESELQHCCDSGTLNLARTALVTPQVSLNNPVLTAYNSTNATGSPYAFEDFFACIGETTPDNSKGVNLLNMNTCAAQALLVANNAEVEGTPTALSHAFNIVTAYHIFGYVLRNSLEIASGNSGPASDANLGPNGAATGTTLQNAFTNLGQSNALNMFGDSGSALQYNKMALSWMDVGNNSSIYVDPATVSTTTYKNLPINTGSLIQPVPSYTPSTKLSYVKGYQAIPIINNTDSIAFIVDLPQLNTSLVSLTDFDACTAPLIGSLNTSPGVLTTGNLAYLPPNAFEATCQATQNSSSSGSSSVPSGNQQNNNNNTPSSGSNSSSNVTLSTLACALIGAVGNGNVASIPAGYIEVVNGISTSNAPVTTLSPPDDSAYDADSKDVFDDTAGDANHLRGVFASPPIATHMGTAILFTTNLGCIRQWYDWANSYSAKGAYGHDDNLDPLKGVGQSVTDYKLTDVISPRIRIAAGNCPGAQLKDLLAFQGVPNNSWSYETSDFGLTTMAQIIIFIASGQGDVPPTDAEMNLLVTKDASGNYLLKTGSMFPVFDGNIDGSEPSYVAPALPFIASYYDRRKIQRVSAAQLFKDGVDIISFVKLQLIKHRAADYSYVDKYVLPAFSGLLDAEKMNYIRTGKLFWPKRWGINPFTNDPIRKYAYVQHLAIYSAASGSSHNSGSETVQTSQIAFAATPVDYINDINSSILGPVPYNTITGSTSNGINSSSGTHAVDLSEPNTQALLNSIYQRCEQMQPGITMNQVIAALSSTKLGIGQTGYLYVDQNSHQLTFSLSLPYLNPALPPEQPDSSASSNTTLSTGWITIAGQGPKGTVNRFVTDDELSYNSLINTAVDGKYAMKGDSGIHKVMYKKQSSTLQYRDMAVFMPSSGYHNLLGVVSFETDLRNVHIDDAGNLTDAFSNVLFSWPN